jgi:hypothetical protein
VSLWGEISFRSFQRDLPFEGSPSCAPCAGVPSYLLPCVPSNMSSTTRRNPACSSEGCWCQGGPLWLAETLCFTYPQCRDRDCPEPIQSKRPSPERHS